MEEVRKHGRVLTPGRYVGAAAQEEDADPFEEKMNRLAKQLAEQMEEGGRLDESIRGSLRELGFPL